MVAKPAGRLYVAGITLTEITVTVKFATPPTVTTTLPVVAPAGTGTKMAVGLQIVGTAAVPLNVTVLLPWLVPKLAPVIVTGVPTGAEPGLRFVMLGGGGVADPASAANTPSAGAAVLQLSDVA